LFLASEESSIVTGTLLFVRLSTSLPSCSTRGADGVSV
jgi:hypothetical protein